MHTRRQFLKTAGAAGAALSGGSAYALHHGRPLPQSLTYLDQHMYFGNMELISHVLPGQPRPGGMAMMSIGPRRFLFQGGDVIEVSDPRDPRVVNKGGYEAGGLWCTVAYNLYVKKWILITCHQVPYFGGVTPGGKYDDPTAVKKFRDYTAFRGIKLWDVSDPARIVKISEFNTGPTGSGPHSDGLCWDGGRYAYLDVAPDNSFTGMLGDLVPLSNCLMIVDVSDPAAVKEVSRWWLPGQRNTEIDAFKKWPQVAGRNEQSLPSGPMTFEEATEAYKKLTYPAFDRYPYTMAHGPCWVGKRVEDGGTRGYGSWGALGMMVFDLSDIGKPKVLGRFDPAPAFGMDGIPFHTIWLGTLDRGFVVSISESFNPDCNESWLPCWVIDVRDDRHPVPIAQLPRPRPPKDAPYTDFCFARGRFGTHSPPALNAPGRVSPTFLPIATFNAGLRCYDLAEPTSPKEVAWFVAPHGGVYENSDSFNRPADNMFVEWDRRLMYVATTTGLYVVSSPALGDPVLGPMPVREWATPSVNAGAPV